MAYNYGLPPNAYGGRPPGYGPPGGMPMGQPPAGFGAAPGMDPPPPGLGQPPNVAGMPAAFQPLPNMPNINFNAPVIRLGLDGARPGGGGPAGGDRGMGGGRSGGGGGRGDSGYGGNESSGGNRHRMGLGADPSNRALDRERAQVRENMLLLQPPTREEVARTIFIGGLGEGAPSDEQLEGLLRCAGKLRRWTRVKDADDKLCRFGFAEYEDVESLEAASEIYKDIEVPLFDAKTGQPRREDGEDGEIKKMKLLMVVDEESKKYIQEWKGRRKEDDAARQFRIENCREDATQCVAGMASATFMPNASAHANGNDGNGDTYMGGTNGEAKADGAETISIPLSLEDELAEIPAELRQTVVAEIRAFRDRSTRRDLERLRREEEIEQAERLKAGAPLRVNRLASPPPSGAPSGPASAANGVPVGPRAVQGAPSGPKGFRGVQIPSDYINGVAFVPGAGGVPLTREDDDAEESDEELERQRKEKKKAELDKQYQDLYRKWMNRERTRGAAQKREKAREEEEDRRKEAERSRMATRLAAYRDDEEQAKMRDEFYSNHSSWAKRRARFREDEIRNDDYDRQAEADEQAEERRREAEARGQANSFLDSLGTEMAQQQQQPAQQQGRGAAGNAFGGFKISLAKRNQPGGQPGVASASARRPMADVEGLLEDEEDAAASGLARPELKPLTDTSTIPTDLTDEEKAVMRSQLAGEIPTSAAELFAFPIKWDGISPALVDSDVRSFVERKVVEYLGVQEDLLVDLIIEGVKQRKQPREIVEELEPALEEEAEVLMKKVWRMLVFFGESHGRGLL